MTDREIIELYLLIPKDKRDAIQREISGAAKEAQKRLLMHYVDKMETLIGFPIDIKCRRREQTDARKVLSYVLHNLGYSEPQIASVIKKDHSTIHVYIEQMDFNLSHNFKNSMTELYDNFLNRLLI